MISADERNRLAVEAPYSDLARAHTEAPVVLGRLMVSLDRVEHSLVVTDEPSLALVAVVKAATDWYRAGVPAAVDRRLLERVAGGYWRELAGVSPDATLPRRDFATAIEKAVQLPAHGVRLLVETRLDGEDHHRPHPLLPVVAEDSSRPSSWLIPEHLWSFLTTKLTKVDRRTVGLVAYSRGGLSGARSMLVPLDPVTFTAALAYGVGRAAADAADNEQARRWWTHEDACAARTARNGPITIAMSRASEKGPPVCHELGTTWAVTGRGLIVVLGRVRVNPSLRGRR